MRFFLYSSIIEAELTAQKTHSASITAGPHTYEAQEKKKGQKIIEMDCRGLEFTEFKPDVSTSIATGLGHHSHQRSGRMGGQGQRIRNCFLWD